jgi:hypothetical protein
LYVSYSDDYDKALASTRCWAGALLPFIFEYPIADPREIEFYGSLVKDKVLAESWLIGTSPEDHIRHLEKFIRLGFTNLHVASSSPDESETIQMYSKSVLPYMRSTYAEQ